MTALLGGSANRLGGVIQFVRAPVRSVADAIPWPSTETSTSAALPAALELLLPLESPWSRQLLAPCGEWTAVVNNGFWGGDSTAPGPAVSHALDVECVVACVAPRYGPGHEQVQLEVLGPTGEPPLGYVRTLSAAATDGRWRWHESGTPFAFEHAERYALRRKRDRFDRELLLHYLDCLNIPARDDSRYGPALLLQRRQPTKTRTMTLDEARSHYSRATNGPVH